MHRPALLLPLSVPLLAACAPACGRDTPERVGGAEEPGLSRGSDHQPPPDAYTRARTWLREHPGACGVACFDAWAGTCSAAASCEGHADHDDLVTCGSNVYLTCDAVRDATGGAFESCRILCEDLRHPSD